MLLSRSNPYDNEVYFYHVTGRVLTGRCYLKLQGKEATLYSVLVEEPYRGLGEGQRMIQEVIREAVQTHGLQKLKLSVAASNHVARHVYFKHGFRFEHPDLGGEVMMWMFLDLGELRKA